MSSDHCSGVIRGNVRSSDGVLKEETGVFLYACGSAVVSVRRCLCLRLPHTELLMKSAKLWTQFCVHQKTKIGYGCRRIPRVRISSAHRTLTHPSKPEKQCQSADWVRCLIANQSFNTSKPLHTAKSRSKSTANKSNR